MKIQPIIYFISGIIVFISVYSCDDIIEKDITNKNIILLAPANGMHSEFFTQTFYWEEVENAINYNLQIVSPSFSNIQHFIIDTLLVKNVFTYTLNPGTYEWRVKAMNGSSETKYNTFSLVIDSTLNLSGQKLLLQIPNDNMITNASVIIFNWIGLNNAEYYHFKLEDSFNIVQISYPQINNTSIMLPSVLYPDTVPEGIHKWSVQAINSISSSAFFSHSLTIDRTAQNIPTQLSPSDSIENSTNIVFSWNSDQSGYSNTFDSVYIYSDQALSNIIVSAKTTNENYSDSLGVGTFYWRVRTFDLAGNQGVYSSAIKIIIYEE